MTEPQPKKARQESPCPGSQSDADIVTRVAVMKAVKSRGLA
eukprot:CAMPEP_0178744198 /NCGR_PEP_ID=MMETSP0744-20121128/6633_1 /TAXON_ID=913974 /ORGANISM="Nitzschia punctata, Strain CCMP561" /LENGTH=40 /DNA_ID= /DNA_START= /DNA_END= /DNA_ORIENTATION=